jgi:hypothetical protein
MLQKSYKKKTITEDKGDRNNLTLEKPLDSITEEDLKRLIENQVLEKKDLDYKLSLPSNSDAEKKEFLADVSSLANSSGGDLIFGMAQENSTGLPIEVAGIDSENVDKEILRLESMVRDGIEPRIPSFATQPIKLSNSKTVLVLRVQKSWVSPHRVEFKGDHRFYARGSNGKYELDVGQLRNAFAFSNSLNENIKRFRENRVASIYANETPIPFYTTAKMILTLVPLASFNPSVSFDMEKARDKAQFFAPLRYHAGAIGSMRYNLDGLLSYGTDSHSELAFAYTQLYRNGILEVVDANTLQPSGQKNTIPSILFEEILISKLPDYLAGLQYLNVELPIIVFLTLVGVKGYSMTTDILTSVRQKSFELDKDVLLLPETIVNSYNNKAEQVLKPAFDAIWNACGFPRSQNYNEKGEWKPKKDFPFY